MFHLQKKKNGKLIRNTPGSISISNEFGFFMKPQKAELPSQPLAKVYNVYLLKSAVIAIFTMEMFINVNIQRIFHQILISVTFNSSEGNSSVENNSHPMRELKMNYVHLLKKVVN